MSNTTKIVIAVVLAVIVLPIVAVVVVALGFVLLGALAGAGFYTAVQQTVACGSEAEATAALALAPDLEYSLGNTPWDECLTKLGVGYAPTYGRYWVEVGADGPFAAHGIVDLDADGVPAHFAAAEGGEVTSITPDDVY